MIVAAAAEVEFGMGSEVLSRQNYQYNQPLSFPKLQKHPTELETLAIREWQEKDGRENEESGEK